jgi:putative membrane protein
MKKLRFPVLLFLVAGLTACAADYPYGPGGGWGHMMYYGYGGGVMWILFLVVIAALVFLVLQYSRAGGGRGAPGETPLDILKKRYARGEITKEDFDRMKRELSE